MVGDIQTQSSKAICVYLLDVRGYVTSSSCRVSVGQSFFTGEGERDRMELVRLSVGPPSVDLPASDQTHCSLDFFISTP